MQDEMESYLSDFSYEEIESRIALFNENDFSKMDPSEILNKVVMLFARKGGIPRGLYQIPLPKGSLFYRVRKVTSPKDLETE